MGIKSAAIFTIASMVSGWAMAESSYTAKVGAEMWWPKTKVNEVNRDSDTTPSGYLAIEHDMPYLPDARLRYSSVDADYMAFDKLDLTLYYRLLEHDLMHFDAGVTLTDLSDTKYVNAQDINNPVDFDGFIWAWYGYAELTVPNTHFDIIGEMNFGNNNDIKSTDLMAGVQYRLPLKETTLAFRGGYRVIDLESGKFDAKSEDLGKSFIFANGFFVGAEWSF